MKWFTKKDKKTDSCCNIEIEEVQPEQNESNKQPEQESSKSECC